MSKAVIGAMMMALATMSAAAFNSSEWLGKREVMTREAERLHAVYSNCCKQATAPARDVTVPVENYADGTVKTLVYAKEGQYFLDSGLIWAMGVEVKSFTKKGELDGLLNADYCVVDRQSKSGWADGHARVVHGDVVFSGKNAYFSSVDSYVKVFEDSRVELRGKSGLSAAMPAVGKKAAAKGTNGVTTIESRESDFDRDEGVVMFEGAARVDYDGKYQLAAQRAFAFLTKDRELSRVVALGEVAVTNGTRNGSCARAIYRRRSNVVEMFEGDGVPAKLVETGKNESELEGGLIRFWVDTEQVEVECSVIRTKVTGKERIL